MKFLKFIFIHEIKTSSFEFTFINGVHRLFIYNIKLRKLSLSEKQTFKYRERINHIFQKAGRNFPKTAPLTPPHLICVPF